MQPRDERDLILYRQEFGIRDMDFLHAGEASIEVKNIVRNVGGETGLIRRVAVAAYEAEMNAVVHGRGGCMIVELDEEGLTVVVEDEGPGIEDIDLAMQEGWSTASDEIRQMGFGAGMGLPNMKRNADSMKIDSEVDRGTRVILRFHCPWGRWTDDRA